MKKIWKSILSITLVAACLFPMSAKEIKRKIKPAKGWVLYMPGKNNSKNVQKDLAKSGWLVSNSYDEHFSFVDSDINETIPQVTLPIIIENTIKKIMIELILLVRFVFFIKYLIAGSINKDIINAMINGI